jgi:hypothetical protein
MIFVCCLLYSLKIGGVREDSFDSDEARDGN